MGAALLMLTLLAFEDPPRDVIDFFRVLASELVDARHNPPHTAEYFLKYFDKTMPGYAEFSSQIEAMIGAGEVSTTIDFINTTGDNKKRTLDLDWLLLCHGQSPKRAVIKCTIEKRGKKWKITSLDPIDFFKRE
jgi:hypothetical protein